MAIIAVTGKKGGTGKSTLAGNLAAELSAMGRRVLVLDTDEQQTIVNWASLGESVLSRIVRAARVNTPEQLAARVELAKDEADRVIIDTAPGEGDTALTAALLADLVLLPSGPSPFDVMAAREALETAREARRERGGRKPIIRFVPNKIQGGTTIGKELPEALADLGVKALPGISLRVAIAECGLGGLTVREYAPPSHPARAEFEALAKAVEDLL